MHAEAMDWIARHATAERVAVLDLGGRDINGSPRGLFPAATAYVVLDIADGPGVDVVADAATWNPDRAYDVVVCAEVFEHTEWWRSIITTAHKALRPGGRLIVTTAAPGRAAHSAVDGGPLRAGEYYGNIHPDDLRRALVEAGFVGVGMSDLTVDVRAVATKAGA